LNPSDRDIRAAEQLMALWGHLLDGRQWDRLDECLAADAVYDGSIFGFEAADGIAAIRAVLSSAGHAHAHHATNVVVSAVSDRELRVLSKGIGVMDGGVITSVTYDDTLKRTASGWRIARRVLTSPQPPPSGAAVARAADLP
jgi:hypothetical protein